MIETLACLALTVYHEARGEPESGQRAVIQVVLNRAQQKQIPVCDVLKEKHQFSWVSDKKIFTDYKLPQGAVWDKCLSLAKEESLRTPPHKITYFHHVKEHPKWRYRVVKVMRIKNHIFYRA